MKATWTILAPFTMALSACAPMDYSSRIDLLGDPAPVTMATRAIVITPATTYVNVTGGEIVKFVVGDKSFAWNFDGEEGALALNLAAPPGTLDHKVIAYIAPNPLYSGDGGRGGRHGGGGHGGHGGDHR